MRILSCCLLLLVITLKPNSSHGQTGSQDINAVVCDIYTFDTHKPLVNCKKATASVSNMVNGETAIGYVDEESIKSTIIIKKDYKGAKGNPDHSWRSTVRRNCANGNYCGISTEDYNKYLHDKTCSVAPVRLMAYRGILLLAETPMPLTRMGPAVLCDEGDKKTLFIETSSRPRVEIWKLLVIKD